MKSPVVQPGKALICGSMAFDTIMVFQDQFKNHILPDKVHMLNVSFLVLNMRREFGGCAGNIAYNLKLLGDPGYVMATVGHDFGPYAEWMDKKGVPRDYLRTIASEHTGQAFITTDLDNNQITAFHPGAMGHSHLSKVDDAQGVALGIVAPDGRDGMIHHAQQFAEAGIPFIFDPGQGLPMFGGEELRAFIEQATWVTVNEYEWSLMAERTGWSEADIAGRVAALVVTKGGEGSTIYTGGRKIHIPAAKPTGVVDPTGCGDAYRAGLIHGLLRGLPWETTGRIASLLGALKIESRGTQNHSFTLPEFKERYLASFGTAL
jgi:adenosine kinase